jgi:hypothetical protein
MELIVGYAIFDNIIIRFVIPSTIAEAIKYIPA